MTLRPARLDLSIRPGATFLEWILLALDENNVPVDLAGSSVFAQVRNVPTGEVLVDLNPSLITPVTLAGAVTVDPVTDVFTLVAHGLKAGQCIQFITSGIFPVPLTDTDYYVILGDGFTVDTFKIMTLADALALNEVALDVTTTGSGTLQVKIAVGQILIPEITDEVTENYDEAPQAGWDLMIEDPLGRKIAPYIVGDCPISRGYTDPVFL